MNKNIIDLSLKLFNAVPAGKVSKMHPEVGLEYGVVINEKAMYASTAILTYFQANQLSGKQLNATFHKSWKVIKNSTRLQLLVHQILHYTTTYGTNSVSYTHLTLPTKA